MTDEARRELVNSLFPPGHYYSPIVDSKSVATYYARERKRNCNEIAAIEIDENEMCQLWKSWCSVGEPTFNIERAPDRRFFLNNGNYCFSDAVVLRAIIGTCKPKRIIEIGAGNSTACILDTIDEFNLTETRISCIEPNPHRLNAVLRKLDSSKIQLLKKPVQSVEISTFKDLKSGDILFIDSTHVLKTGSDVHYELFYILPNLAEGVFVHFHDCPFPFEYPPKWVLDENRSWNEVYALRAFLMYNNVFSVKFWTTFMVQTFPELFRQTMPRMLQNPVGSGIWLQRN